MRLASHESSRFPQPLGFLPDLEVWVNWGLWGLINGRDDSAAAPSFSEVGNPLASDTISGEEPTP